MAEKPEKKALERFSGLLSRREVLVGTAGAALVAGAASAAVAKPQIRSSSSLPPSKAQLRRYMAASAVLGDGRILVTGGYDTPWHGGKAPRALNSVSVYDPVSDTTFTAAPMRLPRARHAAVPLRDGRVAVLGGISLAPTASIEIYDPSTNNWSAAGALAQPRYDHSAVTDGNSIYVIGGSGLAMRTGVEVVYPGGTDWF